nr:F-box/LRR-repeat protein 4-like [Ipomoea batatas]
MERLGDDVIALIFHRIQDRNDRKSCSLVCKQWLIVEGMTSSNLRVFEPNLLRNFLPRYPNLLKFECSEVISNSHVQFLAQTCPRIQSLNLNFKEKTQIYYETDDNLSFDDFDDEGLRAIAKGCCDLNSVLLRKRSGVGDAGVSSLVNFAPNLRVLDLSCCRRVTDEGLRSIGTANSLENLNLQGCCLISDVGLGSLAIGPLCHTLKKLIIAECDRISDSGVGSLVKLRSLEGLDLGDCGPKVTDISATAFAAMRSLMRLNLSWLVNVSDHTLISLAQNCKNLTSLNLTGCEFVTGNGICSFQNHESLKELILRYCKNLLVSDLVYLVHACETLERIVLDRALKIWIPALADHNVGMVFGRILDWISRTVTIEF